jgi:CheY-like chemotaxis protein
MGGAISYASEEGAGSTFTFTVPLGEAGSVAEQAVTHVPQPEGGDSRLLLVEDDPTTRNVIELMLQRAGFELDIAENGRRGIEMWEKGSYDLVLMDVQMPGIDGFEATRIIREKERARGGRVPIVALTAFAMKEDEEKCLAAGMDAYVPKPVDFRRCIEVIRGLIKPRN